MSQNSTPYIFRKTGGNSAVPGSYSNLQQIVGGTIAWNQLVTNGDFTDGTNGWVGTNGSSGQYHSIAVDSDNWLVLTATTNSTRAWGVRCSCPFTTGHTYLVLGYIRKDYTGSDADSRTVRIRSYSSGGSGTFDQFYTITGLTAAGTIKTIAGIGTATRDNTYLNIVFNGAVTTDDTHRDLFSVKNVMCLDLTIMFGSTVTSYLSALETSTPGAAAAWLTKYFPRLTLGYYPYNAGTLQSVNLSAHKTVGFNLFSLASGMARLLGGEAYQITGTYNSLSYLTDALTSETITPDGDGKFTPVNNGVLTVVGGGSDTCVHFVGDGSRDGEYENYTSPSYPMDSSLELRGKYVLDADNNLAPDSGNDVYMPDGTVIQNYGIRAYTSGDENDPTLITDKTNTVYALNDPITETAAGWTNPQKVDKWGTEQFIDYKYSQGLRNIEVLPGQTTDYFAQEIISSGQYNQYLAMLKKSYRKIVKLEFLQPDNSVAFALGSSSFLNPLGRDSRAFLQDGSLSVSLQNGQRRSASVTLSNLDTAFDYNVNKIWFGKRVRLSMGLLLEDGTPFYIPQGVFYITNPSNLISYNQRTTTLSLADKWVYLDGTLFGNLDSSYIVSNGVNIFTAIQSILQLNRFDYTNNAPSEKMIDNVTPVFTQYYNGRTYSASRSDGSIIADIPMTDTPYEITESKGSNFGSLILKLTDMLAGLIGYDATGALRLEPSQDDISDEDKPILHTFSMADKNLIQISETPQPTNVYNSVLISGEGLTDNAVWAKASNFDPRSDTNINLIGQKLYTEDKADYWNADQCAALARWQLKRKTILQKSVSIQCGQVFHLRENGLVAIQRTDKPGAPLEKHLIQGYSIPLGETGSMTLNCTSVLDLPEFTIQTFVS